IYRVNDAFIGFVVPSGHSDVLVYYHPRSFLVGLIISMITALTFSVSIIFARIRRNDRAALDNQGVSGSIIVGTFHSAVADCAADSATKPARRTATDWHWLKESDCLLGRTSVLRPFHSLPLFGWGGWIRTTGCRLQRPMPYHLATPHRADR